MDYRKGLVFAFGVALLGLWACSESSDSSPVDYVGEVSSSSEGADSLLTDNSSSSGLSDSSVLSEQNSSSSLFEFDASLSSALQLPNSSENALTLSSSEKEVSLSSAQQPESSSSDSQYSSSAHTPHSSSSEPQPVFDFYRGADISTVQEYERFGAKFYDVDGSEKSIFTLLKDHGFNAIRLKTFVSPSAKYGYAAPGCDHDAESYADKEHVVAYAQKVKAAGMAFLLDIHYSDNWADPGKQIIPSRWRNVQSSDALADSIYNYTYDLVNTLKQVGATPDMVQVGNETTPGILIHVPNANTNCWGKNVDKASTSINGDMGTASGKANAAKYFKAGIRAVKAVSQGIKTVLHIESIHKTSTIDWWMNEIFNNQKVPADVMGFSAYTAYGDGLPENWKNLFEKLTADYPNLEFIVAEYNGGDAENHYPFDGSRGRTDELIRGMDRWIGAFFWEPTRYGEWGSALFDWKGSDLYANKEAFEEFKPTKKEKDPLFH